MEKLSDWIRRKLAENPTLSQAGLARATKTSRANVSQWCAPDTHVNLRAENLYAVARYFNVDVSDVPSAAWKGLPKLPNVKPQPDNPFPHADSAMLLELYETAAKLPVTRKAKLLELARAEALAWESELALLKAKS